MMTLDIMKLFKKSCEYSLTVKTNSWLADILKSLQNDHWAIIPEQCLYGSFWQPMMDKVKEKYNIGAMCQLNGIYLGKDKKMVLVYFTVMNMQSIKISICNYRPYTSSLSPATQTDSNRLPNNYTKNYLKYLSVVEQWMNEGILTENSLNGAEFKEISRLDIDASHLYPKYYTDKAIATRTLLRASDQVLLEDVAEIIRPRRVASEKSGKCIALSDLKYPLDIGGIAYSKVTSTRLQKGDILIPNINTGFIKPFLFPFDEDEIYASANLFVIRCISIQPEYVFLYLSSETFEIIYDSIDTSYLGSKSSIKKLKSLPIIIPSEEDQVYIDEFEALISGGKRVYSKEQSKLLNELTKKTEQMGSRCNNVSTVQEILSMDIASSIKKHYEEQLQPFLTNDLRELNICFNGKAYKATLILAGSILEAVLIDWLSEIHGINYFENDYYVIDRYGNRKRADLVDYINEIKYIKRPRWIDEANKAHEIRKKRNLVHAKLCIDSTVINEQMCRDVIEYLEDVLSTRSIY